MICGATGKAMFTEERAYEIIDRTQFSGRKRRRFRKWTAHDNRGRVVRVRRAELQRSERRTYRCEHCGQWHLTSKV